MPLRPNLVPNSIAPAGEGGRRARFGMPESPAGEVAIYSWSDLLVAVDLGALIANHRDWAQLALDCGS